VKVSEDGAMTKVRNAFFAITLALVVLATTACIETYDGVFANPCDSELTVQVYYGAPDEIGPLTDQHPIIEADLRPLAVTRVPEAFDDPSETGFTVALEGTDVMIEVDASNQREAARGDLVVVIPATACAGEVG
jgi:hypothetical protein